MFKKLSQKLKFKNLPIFCFYASFWTIVFSCLLEAATYPGIFLNKTGTSLFKLIFILGLICIFSWFQLDLSKFSLKYKKILIISSLSTLFITFCLVLIESLNYPNFVFSKFHINYQALGTLSSFFLFFLLSFIVSKINFKQIFSKVPKVSSKILLIGLLFLTPILSYLSWTQHLSYGNNTTSETRLISNTKNGFSFLKDNSRKQALKDQFIWFFKTTNQYSQTKIFFNLFKVSLSTIFFAIAILFYINWLQNKKSPKIGIALLMSYFGGIAYSIIIILICVTMFSTGELKAFQGRYILTYMLALIMFSFYLFLNNLKKQKRLNISSLIYLSLLFLIINIPNLINLKPANKELFLNRKKQELLYQNIKDKFKNNNRPIFHTIGGEGPVGYRYNLAPYSVISPIWQEWDIFMLENPTFKTATHVFLSSASTVTQKWSDLQIKDIFIDKKFVVDNSVYEIIKNTKNKSSFQLKLIDNFNP